MYGEYSSFANNKKDQQVPTLQFQLDSLNGADPLPLLEEILTHEQNTCIQVRKLLLSPSLVLLFFVSLVSLVSLTLFSLYKITFPFVQY